MRTVFLLLLALLLLPSVLMTHQAHAQLIVLSQDTQDFSKQPTEEEVKGLAVDWFNLLKGMLKLLGNSFLFVIRFFTTSLNIPPEAAQILTFSVMTAAPALVIFAFISKITSAGGKWLLIILIGLLAFFNLSGFIGLNI